MTSGFEVAGSEMMSNEGADGGVAAEIRLQTLETKIDLILGHLANSAAEAAARPVTTERRKTDPKFAALTASIEALAARFDRVEALTLPPVREAEAGSEALAEILRRLDALQTQIETLQVGPAVNPGRQPAKFEAEKVGFERILTGFRLVLRDLSQQALLASADSVAERLQPPGAPMEDEVGVANPLQASIDVGLDMIVNRIDRLQAFLAAGIVAREDGRQSVHFEAEKVGFERILTGFRLVLRDLAQQAASTATQVPDNAAQSGDSVAADEQELRPEGASVDMAAIMVAFEQLQGRMTSLEGLLEARPIQADPARASARFEAEKMGFERLLTGFRLVLRDFADERLKGPAARALTEDAASQAPVPDVNAEIRLQLEQISAQLGLAGTAEMRQILDSLATRIDDLADGLHQIAAAGMGNRSAAPFEAEKVGLTRLLTGFRLVLRDLADRVQQLEVARPAQDAIAPTAEAIPTAMSVLTASSAPTPDVIAGVPEFDPKSLDTIRFRTGLSLILRQLGHAAQSLDLAVERIDAVPTSLLEARTADERFAEILDRLGGIEARLADLDRARNREPASVVAIDATDLRTGALGSADTSLQRLLAGYRFILAGLQRETEGLHTLVARFDAGRLATGRAIAAEAPMLAEEFRSVGSEAAGCDLGASIMMLRAEIDRMSGLSASGGHQATCHDGPASRDTAIGELVKGLRRINALGDRLASTVKAASEGRGSGFKPISATGLAAEIRGETAEFLAIGAALMTEIQRRA